MTKIAIIGLNGFLANPILEQLTDLQWAQRYELPIVAITRDKSKFQDDEKIIYKQSTSQQELDQILQEVDVLIDLVGNTVDHGFIIDSVIKNNLKLYIPSQFGCEYDKHQSYLPIVPNKPRESARAREAGIKTIDIITGAFSSLLYEYLEFIGYDHHSNSVRFIGDPNKPFPVTNLNDIGKVVAIIIGVLDFKQVPDRVRIYSDMVTPELLVERYESKHKLKAKRTQVSAMEELARAQLKLSNAYDRKDFIYYLNVIRSQGVDKGMVYKDNERELVNPSEKYFKWTAF